MTPTRLAAAILIAMSSTFPATLCAAAAAPPSPGTAAPPAARAPATRPTTSPFDAYDPEIKAIGQLKWKDADFEKLDVPTKAAALFALNKLIDIVESKADARADLLGAYLEMTGLGPKFLQGGGADNEKPQITYLDAQKIAAAFIQTPAGQEKFAEEFTKSSPAEQAQYVSLYDKTCGRKFDDVVDARLQVRAMARFLQKEGKFEDFMTWSAEETKRRQKEHEAQLAQQAADKAAAEKERRDAAVAAAEKRRAAEQELALKRLEYSYQSAQQGDNTSNTYNDGGYVSDNYAYGVYNPGYYYYNDAYRAATRARMNNYYTGWNRVATTARPVPRAWRRR